MAHAQKLESWLGSIKRFLFMAKQQLFIVAKYPFLETESYFFNKWTNDGARRFFFSFSSYKMPRGSIKRFFAAMILQ